MILNSSGVSKHLTTYKLAQILGSNAVISYGFADTPFGECFLARSATGILELQFTLNNREILSAQLKKELPHARFRRDDKKCLESILKIFYSESKNPIQIFPLILRGTDFQLKVWKALLEIPFGHLISYGEIALNIGIPSGARAVGSAVAKNSLAYLVPCHRVINKNGKPGSYRWGIVRKKAILNWESNRP
jgi:AraC family transcriptional regulator of adaptative response/methylated-DNA-[protein]-cysteine methyltransferase